MNNISIYKKQKKRKIFVDSQVNRFSILQRVYINEIELLNGQISFTIPGLKESNEINKKKLIQCKKNLELINENLDHYKIEQESLKILLKQLKQR